MLSQQIFTPIHKLTQKFGISWYDLTRDIANIIQNDNFTGKFKEVYAGFCNESRTELFDTEKEAIDFYNKPENYKALVQGDVGENLTEKYK